MFLYMKCPSCGHQVEYVYVQVGHSHCCKKCNYEFNLQKQKPNYLRYVAIILVIVLVAAMFGLLLWRVHDYWIYLK